MSASASPISASTSRVCSPSAGTEPSAGRSPSTRNGLPIVGIGPDGRADLGDETVVRELGVLHDAAKSLTAPHGMPRRPQPLEPLGRRLRAANARSSSASSSPRSATRPSFVAKRSSSHADPAARGRRGRTPASAPGESTARSKSFPSPRRDRARTGRSADGACPCASAPRRRATRSAGSSRASRPSCRRARPRPARPRRSGLAGGQARPGSPTAA